MASLLHQKLIEYAADEDNYPFHMPGHKRQVMPVEGLPYGWDVTEVPGTDDLHHAEGILREAMERAAGLFGSRRTWFLVGGSTCGILAAIRSLCPFGSEVIAARNCHKSVYHAIELGHLKAHWIWPRVLPSFDIFGSVSPEDVRKMLKEFPAAKAVIVTSPTYEGVVSDIRLIAQICHEAGAALIVDEAHGAHLGLFRESPDTGESQGKEADPGITESHYFPDSAVHLGADLVIQSAHKTLPSLTQTALLHIGRDAVYADEKELERQLDIFETSSPSYPLMASLDGCTAFLQEHGRECFRQWEQNLREFYNKSGALRAIQVLCRGTLTEAENKSVFDLDPGKILLRPEREFLTGAELASLLHDEYGIVCEMENSGNVLLMTSLADPEEAYLHLGESLVSAESKLASAENKPALKEQAGPGAQDTDIPEGPEESPGGTRQTGSGDLENTESALDIEEATRAPWEEIPLETDPDLLCGRICAEYIYPYPPGIPVLIPGEIVTLSKIGEITELLKRGAALRQDKAAAGSIALVRQSGLSAGEDSVD